MIYSYWLPFIITAVILNITPGPDMIYLITQSISSGKKTGFASILGFGTGALVHSLLVALGITAIITTSIEVFMIIKVIGAGYLFYMGIKTLLQKTNNLSSISCKKRKTSFIKSYINALIVDLTNPKVAIFFMALLPQFYRNNGSSELYQFMLLGGIIVVIAFLIESIIVLLSDRIAGSLKKNRILTKLFDKLFGTVLIALGIKLVLEKRT